jgi:flagellar protein FliS
MEFYNREEQVSGFGAQAYQRVAVQTAVGSADPHRMTLLLYDGAIEAIRLALAHLGTRRVAAKCEAIGKAARIVEEGLRASVDRKAGGPLAERLVALYDYITMRLLQGNLRNDRGALEEACKLLGDLRSAWAQIGATVSQPPAQPNSQPGVAAPAAPRAAPSAGRAGAGPQPARAAR